MPLLIDQTATLQAGFICALSQILDYETNQEAYEAYLKLSIVEELPLADSDIKLSGLWKPNDVTTTRELADHIEMKASAGGLFVETFLELSAGREKAIEPIDYTELMRKFWTNGGLPLTKEPTE